MNLIHRSVIFILQHTTPDSEKPEIHCECQNATSVQYLDTSCSDRDDQIILDLNRKPTDFAILTATKKISLYRWQYYTQHMYIYTEPETRDMRYSELRDMLMEWNCRRGIIYASIKKARAIPRAIAIQKVQLKHLLTKISIESSKISSIHGRTTGSPNIDPPSSADTEHLPTRNLSKDYLKEMFILSPVLCLPCLQSNIRHEDFRPSVRSCVTLRVPPLNSETGWTECSGQRLNS